MWKTLAALAAVPVAAAVGYLAHTEPSLPKFDAYALQQFHVSPTGGVDDTWQAVPVTGPYVGNPVDAAEIVVALGSKKAVENAAQGKVIYLETKCTTYSASEDLTKSPVLIRKCSQTKRTFKQAMDYALGLLAPEPKS